jgi:hypothetical protein
MLEFETLVGPSSGRLWEGCGESRSCKRKGSEGERDQPSTKLPPSPSWYNTYYNEESKNPRPVPVGWTGTTTKDLLALLLEKYPQLTEIAGMVCRPFPKYDDGWDHRALVGVMSAEILTEGRGMGQQEAASLH